MIFVFPYTQTHPHTPERETEIRGKKRAFDETERDDLKKSERKREREREQMTEEYNGMPKRMEWLYCGKQWNAFR